MRAMLFCSLLLSFVLLACGLIWSAPPTALGHLVAKPDAHKTLVNPVCSHCKSEAKRRTGQLRADERILCWTRGDSDGGAIPIRFFLNTYRVISDTYGVFVYDPEAGFARGFEPSLDFKFYGWRNGVMVIRHRDGTLYSGLSGKGFEGPKAGSRLKPIPSLVSNWGEWVKSYPQTIAYQMLDKYQPLELPERPEQASLDSLGPPDRRLAPETTVLGVYDNSEARAYPVEILAKEGIIREYAGEKPRLILWHGPTGTAAAYEPTASAPNKDKRSPRVVTLQNTKEKSSSPFMDKETKSHWDIAGRATDGELKGWTLKWLDSTQVRWFAWASEYPQSSIYSK